MVFKFVQVELKNAGSKYLKRRKKTGFRGEKNGRRRFIKLIIQIKIISSGSPFVLFFSAARCLDHRFRPILLHTCDINVVLNAMVKVNQAAILLASPGQPRHQPNKSFLLQSMCTRVNKSEGKEKS